MRDRRDDADRLRVAMLTLRCTRRLLTKMRAEPALEPPSSTTRLGDWYANWLTVGRRQVVLCVSAETLLPVVMDAKPLARLAARLAGEVSLVLHGLGVAAEAIERELAEMERVSIATTADRRVLGTMTDFALALPYHLDAGDTLRDATLALARTPCSVLRYSSPDRATQARMLDG